MSLSTPVPSPAPDHGAVVPLWTQSLAACPGGLALAREKGWLLAWDEKHWLYLLGRSGQRQGQVRAPGELATACCADDGSASAAAGSRGQVWWLAPDLTLRWEQSVPGRPVSSAMDPFGQYLAVADARSNVNVFDRHGRLHTQVQCPRPLHHLAFVPAAPFLVGCSDYGLVACLDLAGSCIWRDGLVAHIGSLAVNGDGARIILACFTEGLQQYTVTGTNQGRVQVAETCRLVATTFAGNLTLVAGLANQLVLLDHAGRVLYTPLLDSPAVALTIGPLGDVAAAALADGRVMGLDLRNIRPN